MPAFEKTVAFSLKTSMKPVLNYVLSVETSIIVISLPDKMYRSISLVFKSAFSWGQLCEP